jgi:uncharacterized protein (DUF1786 family)
MTYSIGDEPSSSNYRPNYCNKCDADSEEDCLCSRNNSDFDSAYQQGDKCEECNQDHRYHPDFSGVQISIDIISELLGTQPKDHNILSSEDTDPDSDCILKKDVKSEHSAKAVIRKAAKRGVSYQ